MSYLRRRLTRLREDFQYATKDINDKLLGHLAYTLERHLRMTSVHEALTTPEEYAKIRGFCFSMLESLLTPENIHDRSYLNTIALGKKEYRHVVHSENRTPDQEPQKYII